MERAHHTVQYFDSRSKPRPVIVRYLNYSDKHAILERCWQARNLLVNDHPLLLFADYSDAPVQDIFVCCCTLYRYHTKFTLEYPAFLHIQPSMGTSYTFLPQKWNTTSTLQLIRPRGGLHLFHRLASIL